MDQVLNSERRPIVLGMGPSGLAPTEPWSDKTSTTKILTWLSVGEWKSPLLQKCFQLEDLSEQQTVILNAEGKYEDDIDPGSGRLKTRSLVGSRQLTNGRNLLLLGSKVKDFVAKELNNKELRSSYPYSKIRISGTYSNVNLDPSFSDYDFTAHVLWHPGRVIKRRNRIVEALSVHDIEKFRDVLTACACLPISGLPPVQDFYDGKIQMPRSRSRKYPHQNEYEDDCTREAENDCTEKDLILDDLDSDCEDFYRADDQGWPHPDD